MSDSLSALILDSAARTPKAPALVHRDRSEDYATLAEAVECGARRLLALGLGRRERVAVWLDKRPEAVHALFAAALAGGVLVPINPLLRPEQVAHILRDCAARVLVTSRERAALLLEVLPECPDPHSLLLVDVEPETDAEALAPGALPAWMRALPWRSNADAGELRAHPHIDQDMAAILYTSGSTGSPKGVVLSHRNLLAGARSVARYLDNRAEDRLLAVLPLSFDYGFSQLSTAFLVGAQAVLMDYLLPRDVIRAVARHRITGLAAVPPLWVQLAELDWPEGIDQHLRYVTNSGGVMPSETLARLRRVLPRTRPFLMYGLTEAFRSTYLPPEELERRPGSMGRAIPNAEIQVVREDGTPCAPGEPGELVHRGALVALGYWNDPARTAERFRPAPGQPPGLPLPEIAVWSGDSVRMDEDGYLYFIGRRDEMIKTSGYRVSPQEIEEVAYASGLVAEAAALGVAHPRLGQAIVLCALRRDPERTSRRASEEALMSYLKARLPGYMLPAHLALGEEALARNANGKIDRAALRAHFANIFTQEQAS